MRRELTDQAEAMARERVQHLGEELRSAGLLPPEEDEPASLVVVRNPGRHARTQTGLSIVSRVGERIGERFPFVGAHLTVLVAIGAVVLIVIAWFRISASSEAVPVPRARTSTPLPAAATSASPASPGAAAAGTEVVVDVAGKVQHPGVLTLPAGSRVVDAIKRAGGVRGNVDLSTLNLARVVIDGEQILVGATAPAATGSSGPTSTGGDPGGTVSLNQATLEQLEALPGVGPVTAQKILDYRTAHGAFGSVDELLDVQGIGEKTLAELAPHLTL